MFTSTWKRPENRIYISLALIVVGWMLFNIFTWAKIYFKERQAAKQFQ
jgi:hypothetical protein